MDLRPSDTTSVNEWLASWKGFVYMDGTPAGEASVRRLVQEHAADLPATAQRLKGAYVVSIENRRTGVIDTFIDPSGIFHAFYSRRFCSPSFLELAAMEHLGPDDFAPETLVEFLHNGYISFGETFFAAIRRMDPEHVFRFRPGHLTELLPRQLNDLNPTSESSFEESMRHFAQSIAAEHISVDLTGGIDSRLLAVMLRHLGLTFECALSGMPGNSDIPLAERVANALGCPFHVAYHQADDLEGLLPVLFTACDGIFDVLKAHRLVRFHAARRSRGVTLSLSGAGGELYKDFWWLQDFPLYCRKRPNLARLFDLRMAGGDIHSYLTSRYYEYSQRSRQRNLDKLSALQVTGNTQTYDRIYYQVKMRDYAGRFLTNHCTLMPCYAPYLERELVSIGYNLPRYTRAFNGFHRRMTTLYNPAVAGIETTEGRMTVSVSAKCIASDVPKYLADKSRRLVQKLGFVSAPSRSVHESPNNPELWNRAKELVTRRHALERLQEYGLLSSTVKVAELTDNYIGTVLSLDLLFEYLAGPYLSSSAQKAELPVAC